MDIATLKRDSASIGAGQWVGDIPGMGDLRLKVRGMTSKVYISTYSRLARAVSQEDRDRTGTINADVAMSVAGAALHEAVLLDWEGLTSDGKEFKYDADVALQWLTDENFLAGDNTFADAVVFAAKVVDRGRAAAEAELEKNS